jgi:hypothetical protein
VSVSFASASRSVQRFPPRILRRESEVLIYCEPVAADWNPC